MPMTIVVTNNAPGRIRGFLASCMCEIGPGIYTAPRMTRAVRERVWLVLDEWATASRPCTVLMTWPEPLRAGGQAVRVAGMPTTLVHDYNGIYLSYREQPQGADDHECQEVLQSNGQSGIASVPGPNGSVSEDAEGGYHDSPTVDPDARR